MFVVTCLIVIQSAVGQFEPLEPIDELEPLVAAPSTQTQESRPSLLRIHPNFEPGTKLYVNATSLALRTGPTQDAALVHYVAKDDMLTALQDVIEPVPLEIGGKKGQWLYVQHGQHKGYVFDAYLVEAPPALLDRLDWVCVPGQRVGPITPTTTLEDLKGQFGAVNLALARIPIGEGEFEEGTAIFPGDKAKELIVQWAIPEVKPKAVIISGTQWKTEEGIGIGTRLSKLVEANNAPVSFAGFEWDYAGYITGWRGGTLEKTHTLRQSFTAYLSPEKPYLPEDYNALLGDSEFSSDMEEASRVNLKVSSMTISFGSE
jgi:hypothetical protein